MTLRTSVWRLAVAATAAALLLPVAGCGAGASPPVLGPGPAPSPSPSAAPAASPPAPAVLAVPRGVTAGIAVFDRRTGTVTAELHATTRFRSASLVKLLIALDYLWNRGPGYAVPAAEAGRFAVMLRSSDDDAASHFWRLGGADRIVTRMASRLRLADTAPPSAVGLTGWGSTTLSAADVVRIYRYVLDDAPAPVREQVMGHLHASTRCGTDRYDQSFGIPAVFGRPWSAKQGWYGFGDDPAKPCVASAAPMAVPGTAPTIRGTGRTGILSGAVLHTTGTVGADDRSIVAVLTQYPPGTPFADAVAVLGRLVASLPVPNGPVASPAPGWSAAGYAASAGANRAIRSRNSALLFVLRSRSRSCSTAC